jgi:hypothetical protein
MLFSWNLDINMDRTVYIKRRCSGPEPDKTSIKCRANDGKTTATKTKRRRNALIKCRTEWRILFMAGVYEITKQVKADSFR